jgi:hypothetical protein
MAHINYPTEQERIEKLFKDIKAKHDADAATVQGSILANFLTEQAIDLAADAVLMADADAAHNNFLSKEKQCEVLHEERDNLFDKVFAQHREMVQFLKKLKRGKVHELGDWGVTVDGTDKIVYPAEFTERKKCVKDFITKHQSYPVPTSPLKPYLDEHPEIDIVQNLTDATDAEAAHNDFLQAGLDKENLRETRDLKLDAVTPHILGIGQYLVGIFNTKPRTLGDWGYAIDDANAVVKEHTFIISEEAARTIYHAVIGSVVENVGDVAANIYPGTKAIGTPIVLNPNEKFVVKYRYGTLTTENPGNEGKVKLNVTTYRS